MRGDLKEIYYAFDGKLVGSRTMKQNVCEVLSKMSPDVIRFVTHNCWFFASMEDAWAFTFTGNDLKNQHLIFLSDELMLQSKEHIYYTIAHEIGHVTLGHRNSVLERQSKQEVKIQEEEAGLFAKQFGF